uniref:Uncharacterized protein n=1 Tax=Arundo donax TaxID=35708 RepID=A0A0A9A0V8_ARUDO
MRDMGGPAACDALRRPVEIPRPSSSPARRSDPNTGSYPIARAITKPRMHAPIDRVDPSTYLSIHF